MADDVEGIVKREVAAARAILREDRILKSHAQLHARFDKHFPEESEGNNPESSTNDPDKPPAPQAKPPQAAKTDDKPKGIWWGAGE
jgi:hypothetical protein